LSENLASTYKHTLNVYVLEGIEQFDRKLSFFRANSAREDSSHGAECVARSLTVRNRKKTILKKEIDKAGYFTLQHISLLQTAD